MSENGARAGVDVEAPVRIAASWVGAWRVAGVIGALALGAAGYGMWRDPTRFAAAFLFSFYTFLSIALGALFFVLVQHLTKAEWSVTVRRASEFLMAGIPVFLVLVIPILATTSRLYPWDGVPRAHETVQAGAFANGRDEGDREPYALRVANSNAGPSIERAARVEDARVLDAKRRYMNRSFFALRAIVYLFIWSLIALRLFRWSTKQDEARSNASTLRASRFAPAAMVAFAITVCLAAFDWLMSLDARWSSSAFGLYVFAGCAVAHAAAIVPFTRLLQRGGLGRHHVTVEHYHDLGKWLFGWISFWAYLAYVQFFLAWYANLPEEISFFHARWGDSLGSYKPLSVALIVFHFLVPFWLLLSRHAKRSPKALLAGAVVVLTMHVAEAYWLVMPNFGPLAVHWLDVACFVGVGGVYAAAVLRVVEKHALVPIGDPRLARALAFENG